MIYRCVSCDAWVNDDENVGTETPGGHICEGCAAEGEEMKDINEWYAEKCGIKKHTAMYKDFSIKHCSDREIIREMLNICTTAHRLEEGSNDIRWFTRDMEYNHCVSGKTIAEAEIACLEAIYKTEVKNEQNTKLDTKPARSRKRASN
jgi:hypothetical protein